MTLAEALFAHLTAADSPLHPLIGTRLYPGPLPPQAKLPAVTYQQAAANIIRTMGGRQGRSPRYQFDCWGATRAAAHAIGEALIERLDHYDGLMGGTGGVTVRGAFMVSDLDDYEPTTKQWRRILDFEISHEEGV